MWRQQPQPKDTNPFRHRTAVNANGNPRTDSSSFARKLLAPSLRATAKGATVTLGSTLVSCVLALYIEAGAHKLLYRLAPHKYARVSYANGLTQAQLDAVRPDGWWEEQQQQQQQRLGGQRGENIMLSPSSRILSSKPPKTHARVGSKTSDWNLEDVISNQDISACAMTG